MKFIEIKLTKCILLLTEQEVTSLLAHNNELWAEALIRGKHSTRAKKLRGPKLPKYINEQVKS